MEKNSMLALSERIKSKKREDQERIQAETQRELQQHAQNLRDGLRDELATTQGAISDRLKTITTLIEGLESSTQTSSDQVRQNLQKDLAQITEASTKNRRAAVRSLRWGWLKYSLPALLVLLTICVSSWGLMLWQSSQIIAKQEQIQEAQRMLDKLPQGVEFVADGQGKSFLIYEKKPVIFETQLGVWATELNK